MNKIQCIYPNRDAVLVAYLYDDIDQDERVAFESHLATCRLCDDEFASLRGVRETLGEWAPPEPARAFTSSLQSPVFSLQSPGNEQRATSYEPRAWWHNVPVWAQVAAAVLVLGASASIANLDVRYDHAGGLSVRTGWSKPAPVAAPAAQATTAAVDAAPWRADLAALQNQLRSELRSAMRTSQPATVAATSAAPAGDAMPDAEFRRRVRVLLDESEKKQQNELALHLAQLQSDVYAQRQADLAKINQNIGFIQNTYGNTYGDLRNYVLKVSQKQ